MNEPTTQNEQMTATTIGQIRQERRPQTDSINGSFSVPSDPAVLLAIAACLAVILGRPGWVKALATSTRSARSSDPPAPDRRASSKARGAG
jgi:hypothetical protein